MQAKPKLIAVVGPTCSGKSALGVFLAQKLKGEVISADSRQVYKGLNIGTGKVTKKEMSGVPHHLLNVASPKRQFNVADFVRLATPKFRKMSSCGKVPVVVGGTGLYVDALLGRISFPHVAPNKLLRAQLERFTVKQLYSQLKKIDPRRAKTIEPQHKRRLIRAIEIAKALGSSPTSSTPEVKQKYNVLWLGLNPKDLSKRITARLRARMRVGLVQEARKLHRGGLSYRRMETLGLEYRYVARHLQCTLTKQEMSVQLEREIQKYSKRQMRWFKRNKNIHWVTNKTEALRLAKGFLSR